MAKNFGDKISEAIAKKGTPICVGLDPRLNQIPDFLKRKALASTEGTPLRAAAEAVLDFNKGIIDAVADIVPVCKPQIAFYEILGHEGIWAYEETLKYAKQAGMVTIADAKRNDIGSTAKAYAEAFLGETVLFGGENEVVTPIFDADSVTITPYLGWDGIKPFIEECKKYDKGIFVLLKTSNPSSGDLQDLEMNDGNLIYEIMGSLIDSWGADEVGESGYSSVGAVVGATYPQQAAKLRHIMPNTLFLIPGYGAQGGGAEDVKPAFKADGTGAMVNSSRGIIYAYEKLEGFTDVNYADAARQACLNMKEDLKSVF